LNFNLLIIAPHFPEPSTTAAGGRMLQIINLFLAYDCQITFSSTATKSVNSANLSSLNIKEVAIKLNDSSFDTFLQELQPNIVLFDRFITEEQFGWRVAETCPDALRILDTEDLHFLRKAREEAYKKGVPVTKSNYYTETAKRELASIYRCDVSLLISEVEVQMLTEIFKVPSGLLFYLPFLLPSAISEIQKKKQNNFDNRQDFIAIGNFKHAPNVASVKILKEHIWPALSEKFPQASLLIYGAYAPQQIQEMNSPNERFFIKGWTKDLSAIMQNARVQLAPLPFGAGLKGKLLDAMCYGLPSVTTTIGSEGMYGSNKVPGGIADTWEQFITVVALLYTEKRDWLHAQQQGYAILETRFQKHRFAEIFSKRILFLSENLKTHRQHHFIGQILQHQTLQATKYLSKWIEAKNS